MNTDIMDRSGAREGSPRLLLGMLLFYGLFWTWLAIAPVDRRDWLLENLLSLTLFAVLVLTYRRFQFSATSYYLIGLFLTLHAVGAHYTYAEVPFGFWLKDFFVLSRNPFDRLAHFAYGALLVYPLRELLVRLAGVRGGWASFLSVSGILAQSGFFEIAEAVVASIVSPELGSTYLGTQGDEWDAQKDMAVALAGALLTIGVFSAMFRFSGRDHHLS
jgi:putative membrane protein